MTRVEDLGKYMSGFSKLSKDERFERLMQMGVIDQTEVNYLKSGGLPTTDLAEKFIENVIGYFQLPMGVATNFRINGRDVVIPMAVEETSIIAAASKTARWIRKSGKITTKTEGHCIIGQIQLAKVRDVERVTEVFESKKPEWIALANEEVAAGLVARGGGVEDIVLRKLERPDGSHMVVFHVLANTCDAMGANIINQVCEFLKSPIETLTDESVTMCILSNLTDTKLTVASVEIAGVDPEEGRRIEEASLFSQLDPYRAATNNKGVLNGIDPILIATGNDWRAVESGMHAYAARDGQYRSLTTWEYDEKRRVLAGELVAPIAVGVVGGVTKLHPTAQLSLSILEVKQAHELAEICASVGLVQNLGALRALTSVGIIEGHMKLHIKNLTLGAGASENEVPYVASRLEEILALQKRISLANAVEVLQELRNSSNSI